jgi:hypothetical protein
MQDAMDKGNPTLAVGRESDVTRRARRRTNERCSICTSRIWFDPTFVTEPEGVPEPRRSWVLCRECYQALVVEMRRSPVRSPLRLRIAVGLVAADRWPQSRSSSYFTIGDRRKILFIVWTFIIAMIVHLALIVYIAMIAH